MVAWNIVQSLRAQVDFTVFYFDPITDVDFGVKTHRLKFTKDFNFAEFDLIHSHMLRPDLYLYLKGWTAKKPVVSTVHQFIDEVMINSYGRLVQLVAAPVWKMALKKMNRVVCLSRNQAEYYRGSQLNPNIDQVYNGVQIKPLEPIEEQQELEFIRKKYTLIGSVSLLRKIKGVDQVIIALTNDPSLFYLHIGGGEQMPHLQELARKLKVIDRVWFLGQRNNATDYLPFLDVFVSASRSEGFGLSVVEAVASRVPVACSDIPGFRELFCEQEVCHFPLDQPLKIVEAIQSAMANAPLLTEAAYRKYKSNYTIETLAIGYWEVYQRCLGNI